MRKIAGQHRLHTDVGRAAPRSAVDSTPKSWFYVVGFVCQIRPVPVKPAVETVEKAPFQNQFLEEWGENTEKNLIFCVRNNILAILEPVVEEFV